MAPVPAAKEKTASDGEPLPQAQTRVWGLPLKNANAADACGPATSTLAWGWRQSYAGTALDSLDQRYYTATAGRFYTPDPKGMAAADLRNPTSWNMYAYVNADPVNFMDSRGTDGDGCNVQFGVCFDPPVFASPGLGGGGGGGGGSDIASLEAPPDFSWGGATGSYLTTFPLAPGLTAVNPAGSRSVRNMIATLGARLDQDCINWLTSAPNYPTAANLAAFFLGEMNGGVGVAQFVDSSGDPSSIISQAKLDIAGFNILINTSGNYFATTFSASGIGNLNNGTDRFQAFTLLHEFAHQLGVPGFLAEGGNGSVYEQNAEAINNRAILDHCNKTLGNFSNGN
jgi:RHS repeat-associated protein